jgi:hypothetical protein
MERRPFAAEQLATLAQAIDMSEEIISDRYKISSSQWKHYRYDIQSLKDLAEEEITDTAFAQLRRYASCPNERLRGSERADYYKICLQDHVISRALRRDSSIQLLPMAFYIVTHELIHVVRFARFLQNFHATEEERNAEEQRVHGLTAQLLAPLKVPGLPAVLSLFRDQGILERFIPAAGRASANGSPGAAKSPHMTPRGGRTL